MGGVKTENRKISAIALLHGSTVQPKELPNAIKFFAYGENPSNKGSFTVDEASLAAIRAQIADEAHNRILIDFEHQSCKQSPNYQPSPRHHAGYGKLAIFEDNSVGVTDVEYTPAGSQFAADYYDVSPVAIHTLEGRVLGIQSAALVPEGALHGRTLFSADFETAEQEKTDMQAKIDALESALAAMNQTLDGLKSENAALRQMVEDQSKRLSDQANAISAIPTPLSAELLSPFLTPMQAQADGAAEAAAAQKTLLEAQAAAIADQGKQISALSAAIDAQRKETMIQLAAAQGKAVALPDTAIAALSVEDLAAHLKALGSAVPMVRRTPGSAGESSTSTGLAADQNALIARIRKESGETNFQKLWEAARAEKPELFR